MQVGVIETLTRYVNACSEFKKGERDLETLRKEQDKNSKRRRKLREEIESASKARQSLDSCPPELRNTIDLQSFNFKLSEYQTEVRTVEEELDRVKEEVALRQERISRQVDDARKEAGQKIDEANGVWIAVFEQIEVWKTPRVRSSMASSQEYLEEVPTRTKASPTRLNLIDQMKGLCDKVLGNLCSEIDKCLESFQDKDTAWKKDLEHMRSLLESWNPDFGFTNTKLARKNFLFSVKVLQLWTMPTFGILHVRSSRP